MDENREPEQVEPLRCQRKSCYSGHRSPGERGPCPFRSEIHADDTPCTDTCCAECRHECAMDT